MPKTVLSEKQLDFLKNSNASVNVCDGSIRSGKTIITLWRWLLFIPTAPVTGALIMVGKTIQTVWENMLDVLRDESIFGSLSKHIVGNRLSNTVYIMGRRVRVMGGSKVDSETALRGSTICGAMVDEITTLHQNFFTQLLGRMSVEGAQLFGTTNPDSPAHWFKKSYLDKIGKKDGVLGWKRWTFVMSDNPSLKRSYVERVKRQYPGLFYKRFILGQWVAAAGAIFDFWDEDKFVVPHSELPRMRRLYGTGIDFGSDHPSAAIVLGHGEDNVLYLLNEWAYKSKDHEVRLSGYQQAKQIIDFMNGPLLPTYKDPNLSPQQLVVLNEQQQTLRPMVTVVDSAASDLIVSLEEQGVDNFRGSNKAVLEGIRTMSSLFTTGRLKVSSACAGLIEEMPGYTWNSEKSKLGIEEPNKEADDHVDPARYILMSTQSDWYDPLLYNY